MRASGEFSPDRAEAARRVMNHLTAVKALAQMLERRADELPDDMRATWIERLQAIVTAVSLATIEVGLLADDAAAPHRDD